MKEFQKGNAICSVWIFLASVFIIILNMVWAVAREEIFLTWGSLPFLVDDERFLPLLSNVFKPTTNLSKTNIVTHAPHSKLLLLLRPSCHRYTQSKLTEAKYPIKSSHLMRRIRNKWKEAIGWYHWLLMSTYLSFSCWYFCRILIWHYFR